MIEITQTFLIEQGWQPGPKLDEALERVAQFHEQGVTDPKYILKRLKREISGYRDRLSLRPDPLPLAEAIQATSPADEKNIGAVRRQMRDLLRLPKAVSGAVMPDACPAGSAAGSMPVGGVIGLENAIMPSGHSSDICCSMFATLFEASASTSEMMDRLSESTRFGPGGRAPDQAVDHPVVHEAVWENPFLKGLRQHAISHIADQGDGNHFAFLGEMEVTDSLIHHLRDAGYDDFVKALDPYLHKTLKVLVTHHGSRNLGAHLYKRGQIAAEKHTQKVAKGIPDINAWLDIDTPEGAAYWKALQYVQRWTKANHESIHERFLSSLETQALHQFGNEHNFVWKRGDIFYHGKGATPAWIDEENRPLLGLIPLNMACPILLVLGGANEDYLSFSPHGAGRNVSRKRMMRKYRLPNGEFDDRAIELALENATQDIDVRWFCKKPDLTESPLGYKSAEQITDQINHFQLANIVAEIRPLGSIMAGRTPRRDEELTPKQLRQIEHRSTRRKDKQNLRDFY